MKSLALALVFIAACSSDDPAPAKQADQGAPPPNLDTPDHHAIVWACPSVRSDSFDAAAAPPAPVDCNPLVGYTEADSPDAGAR